MGGGVPAFLARPHPWRLAAVLLVLQLHLVVLESLSLVVASVCSFMTVAASGPVAGVLFVAPLRRTGGRAAGR